MMTHGKCRVAHWKTPLQLGLVLTVVLTAAAYAVGPGQVVVKQGIGDLDISHSDHAATVVIRGDTPLHYNCSRRADPDRVVLVFDGASVAPSLLGAQPYLVPEPAPIKKVEVYGSDRNARGVIAVFLRRPTRVEDVLQDDGRTLTLSFGDAAKPSYAGSLAPRVTAPRERPESATDTPAAIAAVTVRPEAGTTHITLQADGQVNFRRLDMPDGQIALAIDGATIADNCPTEVPIAANGIRNLSLVPDGARSVKLLLDAQPGLEATAALDDTGSAIHLAVAAASAATAGPLELLEQKLAAASPIVLGPVSSGLVAAAPEAPAPGAHEFQTEAPDWASLGQPVPREVSPGKGISVVAQAGPAAIPPPRRPAAQPDKPNLGYIGLDFKNTPLADAIQALAYYADANIIVDGDVKGTITMTLSGAQVEEALTVICAMYSLDWAKVGDTYLVGDPKKIAPVVARHLEPAFAQYLAMTQELDNLVALVQGFYPRVKLTPQKDTNRIILAGPAEDVQKALTVLQQVDGGRPAGLPSPSAAVTPGVGVYQAEEILPLWTGANPTEVEALLREFIGAQLKVKVRPIERQLVISGPPYLVERAKQFLKQLEANQPPLDTAGYSVVNQPASVVQKALQARFPSLTVEVSDDQKTVTFTGMAADVAEAVKVCPQVDVPRLPEARETYVVQIADPAFLRSFIEEQVPTVGFEYDAAQRTVTLTGSRDDVRRALALLISWDANSVIETITLQYLDSRYIIPPIAEAQIPGLKLTGAANVLMLEGPPAAVREGMKLVGKFDTYTASLIIARQEVQRVVTLNFVEPKLISDYLTQVYVTGGGAAAPAAAPTAAAPAAAPAAAVPTPAVAPAAGAQPAGPTVAPPSGGVKFFVDETTHQVILNGPRSQVEEAVAKIESLDVPPHQVTLQAIITDINKEEAHNHGLQWTWGFTGFREGGMTGESFFPGIQFGKLARTPLDILAVINFVNTAQYSRLLANPSIKTVDGKKARIHVGDELRYPVVQVAAAGAAPTYSTEDVEVGIILEFTPRIGTNGDITVDLMAESSTVTGFTGDLPQISRRTAQTTVRLKDGETMVLGGLIRDADIEIVERVPILHKIPFFGRLFKNRSVKHTPQELLVFITPRIEYAEPTALSSGEEDVF